MKNRESSSAISNLAISLESEVLDAWERGFVLGLATSRPDSSPQPCAPPYQPRRDDLQYRGYTCWERANYPDKSIIGVRKMPDGSLQFLMHNEALCSPYYLATDGHGRLD